MSFEQGLSGLNAAAKSLDVIGNNIANANAAGFKASSALFSDVYASSLTGGGASSVGIGAQLSAITPQFSQGNITVTSNPLDVAVNGNGFFRMSDSGAITYSRDGQFHLDKSGYIVNSTGLRLTGYAADSNGNIVASAPTDLKLSSADIPPKVTSQVRSQLSIDSRLTAPSSSISFSTTDPTSYNNTTSIPLFDALGNSHVLSLYFRKSATTPNEWLLYANVDGTSLGNVNLGAGAGNPLTLDFNTSGALTTSMPANVSIDLNAVASDLGITNGASGTMSLSFDMTGTTQFGSSFGVNSMDQDGYSAGRLNGLNVGSDGVIQGRYSNGQTKDLGQVVLVSFANNQGLKPLGGSQWAETPESGVPLVGKPGSGNLGVVQASATEDSNVDLTAELVEMITMQRVYQANAQSIKTQDQVLQTLVNLR